MATPGESECGGTRDDEQAAAAERSGARDGWIIYAREKNVLDIGLDICDALVIRGIYSVDEEKEIYLYTYIVFG